MDSETLVRLATTDEDHDEMREALAEVLELPFVSRGPDSVFIPNGQDMHIAAANWLRSNTDREDFLTSSTRLKPMGFRLATAVS